jgi:TonB family protein
VFVEFQPADSLGPRDWLRRNRTLAASVTLHLVALAVIVFHHERTAQLTPTWLAWGDASHTYQITYLPPANEESPADESKLALPAATKATPIQPKRQTQKRQPPEERRQLEPDADAGELNAKAGSPLGRFVDGPIFGHDVHVAYPVVFPEPIDRSELPSDLAGDVIIEVTIDAEGNVVDTRIVQSIGHGIDERIEATLRRWHYEPATLDGAPVASHHDVHFHFPS